MFLRPYGICFSIYRETGNSIFLYSFLLTHESITIVSIFTSRTLIVSFHFGIIDFNVCEWLCRLISFHSFSLDDIEKRNVHCHICLIQFERTFLLLLHHLPRRNTDPCIRDKNTAILSIPCLLNKTNG